MNTGNIGLRRNEVLAFTASRASGDIHELTDIRKDGSRFPAIVPARRMVPRISDTKRHCFRPKVSFP